ncbi:MAG: peptide chain release factor N(5)-glutamine methyltransferase, partial [Clostridia bacterium]|nr:peptide chain release factor N(5)-glutamine methyltransferase [Clostridia bacterium]
MTLSALYKATTEKLVANGIDDAALEARLIIENVLGISYSEFLLKGNDDISDDISYEIGAKADRRIAGEPVQYILGEWDFMGFTFKVGQGVLVPRPETEILCEYVLEKIRDISNPTVYDLCSGSGC